MPYTTLTSGNGQVKMLGDNSLVKCEFITHDGSPDGDTEGNLARIMDQRCFYNVILN